MSDEELVTIFPATSVGDSPDVYDFAQLQLPQECASALRISHRGVTALYARSSRRQQWVSLRRFADYLKTVDDPWREMRNPQVLSKYKNWLFGSGLNKTIGTHYNNIALHYRWLADNDASKSIYWHNVQIVRSGLSRETKCERNNSISTEEIQKISAACKERVLKVRARMALGESILNNEPVSAFSVKERKAVQDIAACIESGILGKVEQRKESLEIRRVGYREVASLLMVSIEDLLPYLLLILIETLANPDPVFKISVANLEEHPLDPKKKRLYWSKPRASIEQYADVLTQGQFSVPRLFQDIEAYTRRLRPWASLSHRYKLFLGNHGTSVRCPSVQSWHNCLELFRNEENLSRFSFVDIRRSGAQSMDAKGEAISAIQKKLQHRSERTSRRYLDSRTHRAVEQEKILRFQGAVIKAASLSKTAYPYETLHGMECAQPLAGIAPGSRRGEPCLQYFRCAQCASSIFLVDSPKHVARMLLASKTLDALEENSLLFLQRRER
ncbi:hypothetical protein [Xanthomonas arboricola]|uniref:hypothetical protein n=1 Tax=Xanthomonas arboricola TaxID=56448 RepID=UPI0011B0A56D|nr:hypothetical protein [Xanthomonas arboricola]